MDHCEVVISSSEEVAEASSSSPLAEEVTEETFFRAGTKPPSLDWRHAMRSVHLRHFISKMSQTIIMRGLNI